MPRAKKQKANLRFDRIDPDIVDGRHFGQWEDLGRHSIQVKCRRRMNRSRRSRERQSMARWLDAEFKKAKLFGSPKQRGTVRRLTRYELRYALEDLLKVSVAKR